MEISLPDAFGASIDYTLSGMPIPFANLTADSSRVVFAAAHVVADPFSCVDPTGQASVDWDATLMFRRHLADHGLGIGEAMDTAQPSILHCRSVQRKAHAGTASPGLRR